MTTAEKIAAMERRREEALRAAAPAAPATPAPVERVEAPATPLKTPGAVAGEETQKAVKLSTETATGGQAFETGAMKAAGERTKARVEKAVSTVGEVVPTEPSVVPSWYERQVKMNKQQLEELKRQIAAGEKTASIVPSILTVEDPETGRVVESQLGRGMRILGGLISGTAQAASESVTKTLAEAPPAVQKAYKTAYESVGGTAGLRSVMDKPVENTLIAALTPSIGSTAASALVSKLSDEAGGLTPEVNIGQALNLLGKEYGLTYDIANPNLSVSGIIGEFPGVNIPLPAPPQQGRVRPSEPTEADLQRLDLPFTERAAEYVRTGRGLGKGLAETPASAERRKAFGDVPEALARTLQEAGVEVVVPDPLSVLGSVAGLQAESKALKALRADTDAALLARGRAQAELSALAEEAKTTGAIKTVPKTEAGAAYKAELEQRVANWVNTRPEAFADQVGQITKTIANTASDELMSTYKVGLPPASRLADLPAVERARGEALLKSAAYRGTTDISDYVPVAPGSSVYGPKKRSTLGLETVVGLQPPRTLGTAVVEGVSTPMQRAWSSARKAAEAAPTTPALPSSPALKAAKEEARVASMIIQSTIEDTLQKAAQAKLNDVETANQLLSIAPADEVWDAIKGALKVETEWAIPAQIRSQPPTVDNVKQVLQYLDSVKKPYSRSLLSQIIIKGVTDAKTAEVSRALRGKVAVARLPPVVGLPSSQKAASSSYAKAVDDFIRGAAAPTADPVAAFARSKVEETAARWGLKPGDPIKLLQTDGVESIWPDSPGVAKALLEEGAFAPKVGAETLSPTVKADFFSRAAAQATRAIPFSAGDPRDLITAAVLRGMIGKPVTPTQAELELFRSVGGGTLTTRNLLEADRWGSKLADQYLSGLDKGGFSTASRLLSQTVDTASVFANLTNRLEVLIQQRQFVKLVRAGVEPTQAVLQASRLGTSEAVANWMLQNPSLARTLRPLMQALIDGGVAIEAGFGAFVESPAAFTGLLKARAQAQRELDRQAGMEPGKPSLQLPVDPTTATIGRVLAAAGQLPTLDPVKVTRELLAGQGEAEDPSLDEAVGTWLTILSASGSDPATVRALMGYYGVTTQDTKTQVQAGPNDTVYRIDGQDVLVKVTPEGAKKLRDDLTLPMLPGSKALGAVRYATGFYKPVYKAANAVLTAAGREDLKKALPVIQYAEDAGLLDGPSRQDLQETLRQATGR